MLAWQGRTSEFPVLVQYEPIAFDSCMRGWWHQRWQAGRIFLFFENENSFGAQSEAVWSGKLQRWRMNQHLSIYSSSAGAALHGASFPGAFLLGQPLHDERSRFFVPATTTFGSPVPMTRLGAPVREGWNCFVPNIQFSTGPCFANFDHLFNRVTLDWVDEAELEKWARMVKAKGFPFTSCVSFVDGTSMEICRPTDHATQKLCYSGYTRRHDLKYLAVKTPCGVMTGIYGPFPGSFHDARMLFKSSLVDEIESSPLWCPPNMTSYHLYGDRGY